LDVTTEDFAMIRTLALFALLGLAACETVQGVGRDLETAGEAIQDEAQDTKSGQ
jgi:predicted small secreted protein